MFVVVSVCGWVSASGSGFDCLGEHDAVEDCVFATVDALNCLLEGGLLFAVLATGFGFAIEMGFAAFKFDFPQLKLDFAFELDFAIVLDFTEEGFSEIDFFYFDEGSALA